MESFVAHTIPQDLPDMQTRKLMILQLQEVQRLGAEVFERISKALDTENERLDSVEKRLQAVEDKIALLPKYRNQELKAAAPLQYPEAAEPNSAPHIFQPPTHSTNGQKGSVRLETGSSSNDLKDMKSKELYAFFKQALLEQANPSQESIVQSKLQLEYVTNLLAFQTSYLQRRLRQASSVADSLVVSTARQGSAQASAQNVHLATPSLTSTSTLPLIQDLEPTAEKTIAEESTPDPEVSDTGQTSGKDRKQAANGEHESFPVPQEGECHDESNTETEKDSSPVSRQ